MQTILSSIELFVLILIRPTRWAALLNHIDNSLTSNFALVDLNAAQWQNRQLQFLLLQCLLLLPCLLFSVVVVCLKLAGAGVLSFVTAFIFIYALALTAAIYVSLPTGVLFLGLSCVIAALQWTSENTLIFDLVTTNRLGTLFGLWSACTIIAAANHNTHQREHSSIRQAGAIVLGLLIGLPLAAMIAYGVFMNTASRQSGTMGGGLLIWTMVLPPLILLSISVFVRTRKLLRIIAPGLFCTVLIATGFGDLGFEYDRGAGGFTLASASFTIIASTFCLLSILPYSLVRPFVGEWPATISGAFGGLAIHYGLHVSYTFYPLITNLLIALGLMVFGIFFQYVWSAITYPFEAAWNRAMLEAEYRHKGPIKYFAKHSACWDEIQRYPLYELDTYLTEIATRDATTGAMYLDRISHSSQRSGAQAALLELDARQLESLPDIEALGQTQHDVAAGLLDTPGGLVLKSFARFGRDISTALAQPTDYNRTLVLRTVLKDIENLQLELARDYNDKNARRFISVCKHWSELLTEYIRETEARSKTQREIPNPYVVGVPLTLKQKVFVGRTDTARYVEDILKVQDHPPLLLYGPRRMGKTSLIYQLHWMLPQHVLPLVVDLQGPVSLSRNDEGFLFALARAMRLAATKNELTLPELTRQTLQEEPFLAFDEWLTGVEQAMAAEGCTTILLALDEFEALDIALTEGTLRDHAILGMFRHIAQHRNTIKLMFVGSHTFDEFKRWSSYFVNAQVIELDYLTTAECHQLILQPIADFPLLYDNSAIDRLITLTRGHPYLLQLCCTEIIANKNRDDIQDRLTATVADIERSIPDILERGQQFFNDIELNQTTPAGRQCLFHLATSGSTGMAREKLEQVCDKNTLTETLTILRHRNLIEIIDGRYFFQVEVVRHWFTKTAIG